MNEPIYKEYWRRGTTLVTSRTKMWSKEQFEKNNNVEETMIFSNFTSRDLGKGRQLICTLNRNNINYERNAELISYAPELYSILKEVHQIVENSNNSLIKKDLYNKIDRLIKEIEKIEEFFDNKKSVVTETQIYQILKT